MDKCECALGFVELTPPLKVECQRINVFHQLLVNRAFPEFVERHIKLTLLLESKPKHAVRFRACRLGFFLATLGHEEALGCQQQMAYHQQ